MTMLLPGMKPGVPNEVIGVLSTVANLESYDTSMTVNGPMLCVFLKNGKSFSLPIPNEAYGQENESAHAMTLRQFVAALPVLCQFYSMLS